VRILRSRSQEGRPPLMSCTCCTSLSTNHLRLLLPPTPLRLAHSCGQNPIISHLPSPILSVHSSIQYPSAGIPKPVIPTLPSLHLISHPEVVTTAQCHSHQSRRRHSPTRLARSRNIWQSPTMRHCTRCVPRILHADRSSLVGLSMSEKSRIEPCHSTEPCIGSSL
jgi:hypothetical protein